MRFGAPIFLKLFLTLLGISVGQQERRELSSWWLAPLPNATSGGTIPLPSLSLPTLVPSTIPSFMPVTLPCTVLACQVQQGLYPTLYEDQNIYGIDTSQYDTPWVYVTNFTLPPQPTPGAGVSLTFLGFNYRGWVYLNGALVADNTTLVGAFTHVTLDVTRLVHWGGLNGLAVSLQRPVDRGLDATPTDTDLAITFVDWAPQQPDSSMGLWQPVVLEVLPTPARLAYPLVRTTVSPPPTFPSSAHANVTLGATLYNFAATPLDFVLTAFLYAPGVGGVLVANPSATFTVPSKGEVLATLPAVSIPNPSLWWPFELTGVIPDLYNLTLTLGVKGAGGVGDTLTKSVGLRQATTSLVAGGVRSLQINHVPILLRGAGWAPDLLLRSSPERTRKELLLARDMGLNSIRLEGKMNDDVFFTLASELGLMVLPGWCCCDAWQHWPAWKAEQYAVAGASMRTQARRMRAEASVVYFLISSDNLPPAGVEGMFLGNITGEGWDVPTISAASAASSGITGDTGVKMNGPYSWVPPGYWLGDAGPHACKAVGGAWGFNTEGGPGEAPMTLPSLRRTIMNTSALWPPYPNSGWGHAGANGGNFHNLDRFNGPLQARYGPWDTLEVYAQLAAAQGYEGYRAMYEGFARQRVGGLGSVGDGGGATGPTPLNGPATGIIQWMLNSAWPSNVWNLYDYFLVTSAPYASTKKACAEPLHAQYSLDDASVWVVNSRLAGVEAGGTVLLEVFTPYSEVLHREVLQVPGVRGNSAVVVGAAPTADTVKGWLAGEGKVYFVRLTMNTTQGTTSPPNTYTLSTTKELLDWDKSTWYDTPVAVFADFTELRGLGKVGGGGLRVNTTVISPGHWEVTVGRPGGGVNATPVNATPVAHAVRVSVVDGEGGEVGGVTYTDNYLTLMGGEVGVVGLVFDPSDVRVDPPKVVVSCFNDVL